MWILRKDLQFQRKENTWPYEPAGELKCISRGFVSLIRGLLNKFIPTYTVAGSKFNQLVVDINNVPCHWMVCIIFLSIRNSVWLKRYEKKVSKVMVNSSTHNKKDNHLSSQIIEHEKRPWLMGLKKHLLDWDRHKKVVGLNRSMGYKQTIKNLHRLASTQKDQIQN